MYIRNIYIVHHPIERTTKYIHSTSYLEVRTQIFGPLGRKHPRKSAIYIVALTCLACLTLKEPPKDSHGKNTMGTISEKNRSLSLFWSNSGDIGSAVDNGMGWFLSRLLCRDLADNIVQV
jgi:hypothetical protein